MHKYDTVHGRYPGTVGSEEGKLIVDGNPITLFEERDPSSIPWGDAGVDYVLECTGLFPASEQARAHFDGGSDERARLSMTCYIDDVGPRGRGMVVWPSSHTRMQRHI